MYDIVFRSATTVVDGEVVVRDVGVTSGRIERIGGLEGIGAHEEVLCEGRLLMPGAIDLHAHLREPGGTHKENIASGTAAALAAGVTTVLDMPNTNPPTTSAAALTEKTAIADRTAHCRIGFFMALTSRNVDELEKASSQPGFAGIKVYMGSTTGHILLSEISPLEDALARVPALFAFHAELESVLQRHRGDIESPNAGLHHLVRPPEAVVEGTRVVLEHATKPERRLHLCHVSTAGELGLLAGAPTESQVTCEVSPHHLRFTHEDTARLENRIKVNPPVQSLADRSALRAAIADGRIHAVATDHAPHTLDEKSRPYSRAPSGVPGLDVMVPFVLHLVQEGELTVQRAFELLCSNPARIAGFTTRGRIAEGFDADLALWDLDRTWKVMRPDLVSRCGWSPFEGDTLAARPLGVWICGKRKV